MTLELLEPGGIYHIYNHAVGNENLFLSSDNYSYFLERYRCYIPRIADTYAYCLMPNHLHFLIEVREDITVGDGKEPARYISKQFSNLFSSYAQAFNKQQNRKGNLFISRFRRKRVTSDEYMTDCIRYIHMNPVHHGFVSDFREWPYTSFHLLRSPECGFLAREKVVKWFGNIEEFESAHLVREVTPPGSFIGIY